MKTIDKQVQEYQYNLTSLATVESKITAAIAQFQEELTTLYGS